MFNLIKYELKGYYKEFIIMSAVIVLLHLLLYTRINVWGSGSIIALSLLVTFAAAIIIFVWNIQLFARDMHSDSGYLLFTIPQKGSSILGAKILTSLLQFVIIGILCFVFNYITIKMCNIPALEFNQFNDALSRVNTNFIAFMTVSSILNYIYFLLIIYFSIALSKIAIKNKRLGKLGTFIIFIVISAIIGKITDILASNIPVEFTLNLLKPEFQLSMYNLHIMNFNISAIIFNIVVFIGLFIGGSYILENKIDL